MLIYNLAADSRGCWRVVFVPEELHLFVEFVPANGSSTQSDWMSTDDFLARVPRGDTHQHALERLVSLISEVLRPN